MIGDLISRSALIKAMENKYEVADKTGLNAVGLNCGFIITEKIIDEQPSVDAVPVAHGEWIKKVRNNGGYIASITCSACGYSHSRVTYNFCPECGADMRKDGANDV